MGAIFSVTAEAEEALVAATAETLVQLRGATATKAKIIEWSVSFDGTASTNAPIVVRLLRQTTDRTGSAASEVKWDPDAPDANCAALHSFSAEPTAGDILAIYNVHPQSGMVMQYPLGREIVLDNATTSRFAIEATAPDAVNALAYIVWEE